MRLVSFVHEGRLRLGALRGSAGGRGDVVDLNLADPDLPTGMRDFLEAGEPAAARAAAALREPPPAAILERDAVALKAAVPNPRKIVCIGLNYRDHAAETRQALPEVPTVFAKYPNVLIGAGEAIVIPPGTEQVDYEAELAFVIGRRGRYVPEADAMEHVAGYACFNDVTARDVQRRTPQWTLGKSFDTFGPLGPALVTADEVPDPQALAIRLTVDGETLQDSSTSGMIFPVPRLVAYLSEVMTLEPGDVVVTGTPAGVGFVRMPPRFLRAGETVRVEIERVGVLENPVVAEPPRAAQRGGS
jgi:acylpyruvate hydrolase